MNLKSIPDGQRADLRYANLSGANLSDTTIVETGETWADYLHDSVPAYLTAGGKSLTEIIASGAWECHSWDNCPTATAFDVHDISAVPEALRSRAEQFIRYFDARLIPRPRPT